MSTRKTTLFYAVLIAIASIAVGMVIASRLDLSPSSLAQTVNVPASNGAPISGAIDATTFRTIARAQTPTVVNISTEARARREMTDNGEDLLQRFFGDPRQPRGRPREQPPVQGTGTGFIIDKAGYILTNNHVVEGADKIWVRPAGAARTERYAATVVGRDALTDSALIQLTEMPAAPLQEAKFGDSDQMQQGDWVMAIGNPFDLAVAGGGHTVTVGVISAIGRGVGGMNGRPINMLQTDAAINPGNSGGPLLNIRGEVVGINTMIFTSRAASSNIGIGFATPINVVRDLLPQLRTGKVTRGVIGVNVRVDPLTRDEAKELGLPNTTGAVLSSVTPKGPADRAGLQPGDVIVEFNGRPVTNNESLVSMVVATKPGTTVPITIYRNNERKALNITVDELDLDAEQNQQARGGEPSEPTETGFGMTLEAITPDVARQLELPRGRGGAIVADIERDSPAATAGVQPNDVILEVNRQAVNGLAQIQRMLQAAPPGRPVFLLLWRDGQQFFVTMRKR